MTVREIPRSPPTGRRQQGSVGTMSPGLPPRRTKAHDLDILGWLVLSAHSHFPLTCLLSLQWTLHFPAWYQSCPWILYNDIRQESGHWGLVATGLVISTCNFAISFKTHRATYFTLEWFFFSWGFKGEIWMYSKRGIVYLSALIPLGKLILLRIMFCHKYFFLSIQLCEMSSVFYIC